MALNPPLTSNGEPCRVEGEYFVMKRTGVEFEFKVDKGNKYTGKGYVILTTCRIVAVLTDQSGPFKSFDIPLGMLKSEEFCQPIFGSNYITGVCKPLFNILPGDTKFKIWFMTGGCGTFVPAFLNMVNSLRKNNNRGHDNKLMNTISQGNFAKTAYIDPNDPSVIFLEQPEVILFFNLKKIPVSKIQTQTIVTTNNGGNSFSPSPINNTNNSNFPSSQNVQGYTQNNNNFVPSNNIGQNQFPMNTNNNQGSQNMNYNNNNLNNNFNNNLNNNLNYNQNQNPGSQNMNTNSNTTFNNNLNYNQNQNQGFQNMNNGNYQNQFSVIPNNNLNMNNNNYNNQFSQSQTNQIDINGQYPSFNDLAPNPGQNYPNNNIQNLNNINLSNNSNQNQNSNPKYFGYFGPDLNKK